MRKATTALAAVIIAVLALAGCHSGSSGAAKGAIASATADPAVAAELAQARLLVRSCFPSAPLDQIHTVHLVFLSSATGKHGPEVVAAREKLFACLGIPQDKRDEFKNQAITAAEHQTPKILSLHPAAGVQRYLEFTLPQLVLTFKGTAAGLGTSTGRPSIPGTGSSPAASPSPSASAS